MRRPLQRRGEWGRPAPRSGIAVTASKGGCSWFGDAGATVSPWREVRSGIGEIWTRRALWSLKMADGAARGATAET